MRNFTEVPRGTTYHSEKQTCSDRKKAVEIDDCFNLVEFLVGYHLISYSFPNSLSLLHMTYFLALLRAAGLQGERGRRSLPVQKQLEKILSLKKEKKQ